MKTITKEDKEKIDKMSKSQLSSYIMRTNTNSGAFRYAIKKFVKEEN